MHGPDFGENTSSASTTHRSSPNTSRQRVFSRRRVLGVLGATGLGTAVNARYNATDLYIDHQVISLEGVPDSLADLEIHVHSDQHIGGTLNSAIGTVQRLTDQIIDGRDSSNTLVIHPGDFICGNQGRRTPTPFTPPHALALTQVVGPLSDLPQYAIRGNHDVMNPDWPNFRAIVTDFGAQFLDEPEHFHDVTFHGGTVRICALNSEDDRLLRITQKRQGYEVETLLSQLQNGSQSLNIVILHNPDGLECVLDRLVETGASIERPTIFIAGHTHGGMINPPIIREWALKKARVHGIWHKGLYGPEGKYAGTGNWQMYVSPGMGNRPELPYRLNADPAIGVIKVTSLREAS